MLWLLSLRQAQRQHGASAQLPEPLRAGRHLPAAPAGCAAAGAGRHHDPGAGRGPGRQHRPRLDRPPPRPPARRLAHMVPGHRAGVCALTCVRARRRSLGCSRVCVRCVCALPGSAKMLVASFRFVQWRNRRQWQCPKHVLPGMAKNALLCYDQLGGSKRGCNPPSVGSRCEHCSCSYWMWECKPAGFVVICMPLSDGNHACVDSSCCSR